MSISLPRHLPAPRLERLRKHLRSVGYHFDAVKARLGLPHYAQWAPDAAGKISPALDPYAPQISEYLEQPEPRDELDVVLRLLLLNFPVPLPAARRVFPGDLLADLQEAGLARVDEAAGFVRAELSLWEIDGLFIVTDALLREEPSINPVMPLFPECYELAQSMLRGECVLDLCTGSGVHALLASRQAREVTGVDVNPRAIVFARFNQALNGIQNATFHEGDLYAVLPPGQPRYHLILANPPYNPATDSAPGDNFYAGGQFGYEITERILRGLTAHLAEGGTCQIITLLTHWKDEPLEALLRRFLGAEGSRYDLLFTINSLPFESVLSSLEGMSDLDFIQCHAKRFEYGMFHLRRRPEGGLGRTHVAPFRPGEPPSVEYLLSALGAAR